MYRKYYEILGLDNGSSLKKVRKAYRKLVLKYHPDKHPDMDDSGEIMKELNSAYAILYRYLQKKPKPFRSGNVESNLKIDYVNDPEYSWLHSIQPVQKDIYPRVNSKRLMFFKNLFWIIITIFCFLIWWCILSSLFFIPFSEISEGNEGGGFLPLIAFFIFFLWLYLFNQLIFIKVK